MLHDRRRPGLARSIAYQVGPDQLLMGTMTREYPTTEVIALPDRVRRRQRQATLDEYVAKQPRLA
jgi:hypothetical protein